MGDTNSNVNHILAKFFDPKDVFHPIVFQDDLRKDSPDVKSAQEANKRMEDIIETISFQSEEIFLHGDRS